MEAGVRVTRSADHTVVEVHGEIDIATAPDVDVAVAGITEGDIVLDLRGVTFMGSVGLASLLRADRHCAERDCRLRLRPSRAVRDLLDMTKLIDRFHIEPGA